jgi:hypothetical protein
MIHSHLNYTGFSTTLMGTTGGGSVLVGPEAFVRRYTAKHGDVR